MSDQQVRVDITGGVDPKLKREVTEFRTETQRLSDELKRGFGTTAPGGNAGGGAMPGSVGAPSQAQAVNDRARVTPTMQNQMLTSAINEARGMNPAAMRSYAPQVQTMLAEAQRQHTMEMRDFVRTTGEGYESIGRIRDPQRRARENASYSGDVSRTSDALAAQGDMLRQQAAEVGALLGGGKGGGGGLPSYIGSVINMLGSAGVMGANLYRADRTMFDLNTPQAMANQMMQLDMYRTSTMWKGGASLAGQVVGGAVGAFAGGGVGALAGAYIGGQIMAPIGEMVATFLNTSKEAQQKLFNTIFNKAQSNVTIFNSAEALEYTLGARGGLSTRGGAGWYGLSPNEMLSYGTKYLEASGGGSQEGFDALMTTGRANRMDPGMMMGLSRIGRFTGRSGWGEMAKIQNLMSRLGINDAMRPEFYSGFGQSFMSATSTFSSPDDINRAGWLGNSMPLAFYGAGNVTGFGNSPEGRAQIQGLYGALGTPKSEAERAFMFTAFRRANPNEGFSATMLRMREGIWGKGNLSAVLNNVPPELRQAYILALTEGKNVNTGLVRELMDSASTDEGWSKFKGRWSAAESFASGKGLSGDAYQDAVTGQMIVNIPKGERFSASMSEAQVESGRKLQGYVQTIALEHEKWIDHLVGTEEAQKEIRGILDTTRDAMMDVLKKNAPGLYEAMLAFANGGKSPGGLDMDAVRRNPGGMYTLSDGSVLTGDEILKRDAIYSRVLGNGVHVDSQVPGLTVTITPNRKTVPQMVKSHK